MATAVWTTNGCPERPDRGQDEELNGDGEGLVATHHEKIRVFGGTVDSVRLVEERFQKLSRCCANRDAAEAIKEIRETVTEYVPSAELYGTAAHAAQLAADG